MKLFAKNRSIFRSNNRAKTPLFVLFSLLFLLSACQTEKSVNQIVSQQGTEIQADIGEVKSKLSEVELGLKQELASLKEENNQAVLQLRADLNKQTTQTQQLFSALRNSSTQESLTLRRDLNLQTKRLEDLRITRLWRVVGSKEVVNQKILTWAVQPGRKYRLDYSRDCLKYSYPLWVSFNNSGGGTHSWNVHMFDEHARAAYLPSRGSHYQGIQQVVGMTTCHQGHFTFEARNESKQIVTGFGDGSSSASLWGGYAMHSSVSGVSRLKAPLFKVSVNANGQTVTGRFVLSVMK